MIDSNENKDLIDELINTALNYTERADRLSKGEELCQYHWSGDPGYECYCSKCGAHICECRSELEIPFKENALCESCSRSPEEVIREEKKEKEDYQKKELAELKRLQAKYCLK